VSVLPAAKSLLTQKQLIFAEINVDDDANSRGMTARSNRNTVPRSLSVTSMSVGVTTFSHWIAVESWIG